MNIQYIQHIVNIIQNAPLIEGGLGGNTGAFPTVAADYFNMNVGVNPQGWGRKIVYILAGAVVGVLLNYHVRIGIMYTAMISGGWTVLVTSFRAAAKTFVESIMKSQKHKKSRGNNEPSSSKMSSE